MSIQDSLNNSDNPNTIEAWDNTLYGKSLKFLRLPMAWKSSGTNHMKSILTFLLDDNTILTGKKTIVDFGCGLGYGVRVLYTRLPNARIVGIDHSSTAINFCRKKYGHKAEFFQIKQSVQVPEADVIICSHVVEHIDDDLGFIGEMLNRCGRLLIAVPYKENLYSNPSPYHVHFYDEHSFDDVPGFQVAHIADIFSSHPTMRIQRNVNYFIKCLLGLPRNKDKKHIVVDFKGTLKRSLIENQ